MTVDKKKGQLESSRLGLAVGIITSLIHVRSMEKSDENPKWPSWAIILGPGNSELGTCPSWGKKDLCPASPNGFRPRSLYLLATLEVWFPGRTSYQSNTQTTWKLKLCATEERVKVSKGKRKRVASLAWCKPYAWSSQLFRFYYFFMKSLFLYSDIERDEGNWNYSWDQSSINVFTDSKKVESMGKLSTIVCKEFVWKYG